MERKKEKREERRAYAECLDPGVVHNVASGDAMTREQHVLQKHALCDLEADYT